MTKLSHMIPVECAGFTRSLLQQIAMGDKAAVQACLARYGGMVWSLALRFLGNAAEAEDATQDIFVELWKNAHRYDPSLSAEPTYITMITRRRLIDRRRKLLSQPQLHTLPDCIESTTLHSTHHVDLVDEVSQAKAAMLKLHPDQQRVLKLVVYQSLTHQEIAQSTGIPLGTVKTHARRGLIRLRELLTVKHTWQRGYQPNSTRTMNLDAMAHAMHV